VGVWHVPSYIKPYTKILSWTIPMVYEEESNREIISDYMDVSPVIREKMKYFKDYYRTTVGKVIVQKLIQGYKVSPEPRSMILRPINEFIDRCCNEVLATIKDMKISLLDVNGIKFVDTIFNALNEDIRAVITRPLQWLVLIPGRRWLTRMCWLLQLRGDIEIRKYGLNNILLVVNDVTFEKINSVDLRTIKRNVLKKEEINDRWLQLLTEAQLEPELEGVETVKEQQVKEESTKIGVVE